jgi:membrane-associated phospholipid phosphatase
MFSRLYLAVHYPSDILVGIIVGFTIAKLFVRIVKNKLDVLDLQNSTNSKPITNS